MTDKIKIYLDDVRTPIDSDWVVVRNYDEFVTLIDSINWDQIDCISLDHDLGDTAMMEYYRNVSPNYTLNYQNITEKTGLDCAKRLIEICLEKDLKMPQIYVHSANPIGSANIMGYINNFLMNSRLPQSCVRVNIKHTIKTQ